MTRQVVRITSPTQLDYSNIMKVWEGAVRSTHYFLSDEDILFLRPLVCDVYLRRVSLYGIRTETGRIVAFMGVLGTKLEMLFVTPELRGMGLGKTLIRFAIEELSVTEVDVNEQNNEVIGFYKYFGFEMVTRDDLDAQGRSFPILHLQLKRMDV